MSEPTVRVQKIRRDSVKIRLIVFGSLAVLLILCSIFSEYLTPCDPYLQDLSIAKAPPSAEHLLGTDRYGRDMLSRVIVGSRTSIFSTLLLVAVITALGTAVGVFCGWHGKWIDTVLMRLSDMFLAFPGLVFALAVAGVLGGMAAVLLCALLVWLLTGPLGELGALCVCGLLLLLASGGLYRWLHTGGAARFEAL